MQKIPFLHLMGQPTTSTYRWTNPHSGGVPSFIDFSLGDGIFAGKWLNKEGNVEECSMEHIIIEIENVHALMQGHQQKTFWLKYLSDAQRAKIFVGLKGRAISCGGIFQGSYDMILHALP